LNFSLSRWLINSNQNLIQLTLNNSIFNKGCLLSVPVMTLLVSAVFAIMLTGMVSSTSFVELSYATPISPKGNTPDPNDLVNRGVQCGPPKGNPNYNAICVNTTVPSAVPSTGIAVAQQTRDILAGLTIAKDGRVLVTFKHTGAARWNTVDISPKGIFPIRADIAMAKQTNDILTAVAIANDGALQVMWVVGNGKWNGPVPISPKGMFYPGGDVAMVKQTNNRLTAWAVGNNGWLYQAWVDGTGKWNNPVWVCCSNTDSSGQSVQGPYRGFDPKRYSIAADRLPNGMLAVLVVDTVGQLNMVPIPGLCNVNRCENIRDQNMKIRGSAYPIPKTLGPWKLFPVGAELAMVQHTKDISTVLSIGNNGAMYVSWFDLVAGATWKDPVQVSPANLFPRGSSVAASQHIPNVIIAFTVGNDGAIHESWATPAGWNIKTAGVKGPAPYPPVSITPKIFNPGAGVAMVKFNGVLEGFVIGKSGGIYTSWLPTVDWLRPWNGPIKITNEGQYQFFAGKPQQSQQPSQPQPPAQPPGGPPLRPPPEFGK
jgi:hypothetical protein